MFIFGLSVVLLLITLNNGRGKTNYPGSENVVAGLGYVM